MALQCKSGVFGKAAVARPVRVAAPARVRLTVCNAHKNLENIDIGKLPALQRHDDGNGSSEVARLSSRIAQISKGDLLNKSYYPTSADASNVNKRWYVIDAEGQTLGRLATLAATYIRGKHLPTYTPSMDMGAYVIVLNADKVVVSGKKASKKTYFRHVTGRPGSYMVETFTELQKRIPERIIERAVKGMLPKGALGRDIRLHLKVYKGVKHEHEAQQPQDITKEISIKPKNGPGAQLLAAKKAA